jgi:general secretion pathway protein G
MRTRKWESGFTLIEMMVVMVIIGLLVALVGPNFIKQGEKAKLKAARAQIEMLGT